MAAEFLLAKVEILWNQASHKPLKIVNKQVSIKQRGTFFILTTEQVAHTEIIGTCAKSTV